MLVDACFFLLFLCFLCSFLIFAGKEIKTLKNLIFTREQGLKHLFTGKNTQPTPRVAHEHNDIHISEPLPDQLL